MNSPIRPSWLHGKKLVGAITTVCSSAFLLFGYDQGVMSGVVVSQYWLEQMQYPSTVMVSTMTALYDVGAVFGAIFAAVTAERLGRRRTLLVGSMFVIVGSVIMGASYERIQMMVGRVVTGIGVGYLTSTAPVYQSEICLPAYRGWHLSCQLSQMLMGLVISYWVNYGFYYCHGHVQWRFPLCLQIVFAIYCIVVTIFLPDSPRWLMWSRSSPEEGVRVLASLRGRPVDDLTVCEEKDEILSAIQRESEEEGSWMDLLRGGGIAANKRFFLALGIQFTQQLTGINIVSYYAPTIFQNSLGMTQERSLFVSGFLQVWYLLASFLTWYMIDRVGRRRLFISMALGMCVILICEAICVRVDNQASNIAAVFFIFAFEACFTWGWMACVWVYPAEILPLRIRSKGAALAAAADFLGNFLVVEIAPPALDNIGYKTYIIFAVFNVVAASMVWCFYPETTGLSLETIDVIFLPGDRDSQFVETDGRFYRKFQWRVVPKAWEAVKRKKADDKVRRYATGFDVEIAGKTVDGEKDNEIEVEHIP